MPPSFTWIVSAACEASQPLLPPPKGGGRFRNRAEHGKPLHRNGSLDAGCTTHIQNVLYRTVTETAVRIWHRCELTAGLCRKSCKCPSERRSLMTGGQRPTTSQPHRSPTATKSPHPWRK